VINQNTRFEPLMESRLGEKGDRRQQSWQARQSEFLGASVRHTSCDSVSGAAFFGGASLKEVRLSSGFPVVSFLLCPVKVRTLHAEARSFVLNGFVMVRCDSPSQQGRRTQVSIAHGLFSESGRSRSCPGDCTSTHPFVHPLALRLALRQSESDRLARYCFLRPSCEAKLVPITPTSLWDCSRRINAPPRTEPGPQGSWLKPRSMQSPLELPLICLCLPSRHPWDFDS
jgi:hypothetical protein